MLMLLPGLVLALSFWCMTSCAMHGRVPLLSRGTPTLCQLEGTAYSSTYNISGSHRQLARLFMRRVTSSDHSRQIWRGTIFSSGSGDAKG